MEKTDLIKELVAKGIAGEITPLNALEKIRKELFEETDKPFDQAIDAITSKSFLYKDKWRITESQILIDSTLGEYLSLTFTFLSFEVFSEEYERIVNIVSRVSSECQINIQPNFEINSKWITPGVQEITFNDLFFDFFSHKDNKIRPIKDVNHLDTKIKEDIYNDTAKAPILIESNVKNLCVGLDFAGDTFEQTGPEFFCRIPRNGNHAEYVTYHFGTIQEAFDMLKRELTKGR